MESDSTHDSAGSTTALTVLMIMLAAFAIRAWGLDRQCLSNDEVIEVEDARESFSEMIHSPDGFPPLFRLIFSVTLGWFRVDLAGRWLSVLFGTLTIAPVMLFTFCIRGQHIRAARLC